MLAFDWLELLFTYSRIYVIHCVSLHMPRNFIYTYIYTVAVLYKEAVGGEVTVCQYPFMALSGGDMGMADNICVLLAFSCVNRTALQCC